MSIILTGNLVSTTGASSVLEIALGGTGQTTAAAAANALLPSQSGNSGKFLNTDGSGNLSWASVAVYSSGTGIDISNNTISNSGVVSLTAGSNISVSNSTGEITVGFNGTLPVDSGGTGQTTAAAAANALLPSQSGNSGKFLNTDGSGNLSWADPFATAVSFGARYDELKTNITATTNTSIDCSVGNVFNLTMSANISTLTLSNIPLTGRVYSMTLFINQDATGSRTISWPVSVKWPNSTVPVLTTTANKTDIITLITHNGGSTWYGVEAGQNF